MLGSPSPKKMIGNGHLPDIHNKDVRDQLIAFVSFSFFLSAHYFQGSPKKGADAKKAAQPAAKKLRQAK
jgi:hypothetical protein